MTTCTAICERAGKWWEITVPELPSGAVTQARRLDQVPQAVRSLVHLMTGAEPPGHPDGGPDARGDLWRGMTAMRYEVRAKRWEHGWELHIDGLGVTQSRTLAGAEPMVRGYIESLTGARPGLTGTRCPGAPPGYGQPGPALSMTCRSGGAGTASGSYPGVV